MPDDMPEKGAAAAAAAAAACAADLHTPAAAQRPRRASWRTYVLLAGVLVLVLYSTLPGPMLRCHRRAAESSTHGLRAMYRAFSPSVARGCTRHTGAHTPGCYETWQDRARAAEQVVLSVPRAHEAREALRRYTAEAHVAGDAGDYATLLYTLDEWASLLGVAQNATDVVYDAGSAASQARMMQRPSPSPAHDAPRVWADTYSVWIDRPVRARLALEDEHGGVQWEAQLDEDAVDGDETSARRVPSFHGYSASGDVRGRVVYAGHGSVGDFRRLKRLGVDVNGSIALLRTGGVFRGLGVRAAQEAGAVGVLMYTDPADDGHITEAHGHAAYPAGPARQPSSVQRGSVEALSFQAGDPSTPGWPSYRNATRLARHEATALPVIPSLPISYANAQRLLADMAGRGVEAASVHEGFGGAIPHTAYWTGPSAHVAHLVNEMDLATRDVWNVYAVIPGAVDSERIMLGNHRDAWAFGAGDPSSGTAVMHEVVRALGALVARGWRPPRTIVLASWDGEEHGLLGSTEFGEDYAAFLQDNVAMYHNLDMAVTGSQWMARASPSLQGLLRDVLNATGGPALHTIRPLGSGSDFTVFVQRLGIPCSDMGFERADRDPVYHYHSVYDSFAWMDRWGDPGFHRHAWAAQVYGLLALRSAHPLFLPIRVSEYAAALHTYAAALRSVSRDTAVPLDAALMHRLDAAIARIRDGADALERRQRLLERALATERVWRLHAPPRVRRLLAHAHRINTFLRTFEHGFLSTRGLVQRPWFLHLGVAPGRWLGYGATTFPGVTESMTLDGGHGTTHELTRLVHALERMAHSVDAVLDALGPEHDAPGPEQRV